MSNFWPIGAGSLNRADWLVFFKVSRTFLKYENGSNFFYDLLRPFPIHTILPNVFKKNVITLIKSTKSTQQVFKKKCYHANTKYKEYTTIGKRVLLKLI